MVVAAMFTLNVIHPGFFLIPDEVSSDVSGHTMDAKTGSASTDNMLEYQHTTTSV